MSGDYRKPATLWDFYPEEGWVARTATPILIAGFGIVLLALWVSLSWAAAWQLLGIGRGLVKPESYRYVALAVILGTTFGQFAGWAAGSALLGYAWSLVSGHPATVRVVQVAMTAVYLGLAVVPITVYHVIYGQPLAGLARSGLHEYLSRTHPGAYEIFVSGHPLVDFSVIPLAIVVLGIIWGYGERALRDRRLLTLLFFLIFATSLAVALSLAIHSALAHVRFGPST